MAMLARANPDQCDNRQAGQMTPLEAAQVIGPRREAQTAHELGQIPGK